MSTWRERYKVHPAADVFPAMSDEELAELGADIKLNGLKVPIVFWRAGDEQFLLVDGRNRFEAMERAGIELPLDRFGLPDKYRGACVCKVSSRKDPLPLIIALNVHRRHLTKEDRARMLAAEYLADACEVSVGGRGKVDEAKAAIVEKAAEQGIGKRTVEAAIAKHREPMKAPEHPNSPRYEQRAKAAKKRAQKREAAREAAVAAARPKTVDDARTIYLDLVRLRSTDLVAEHEFVWEAFQEMMRERDGQAAK